MQKKLLVAVALIVLLALGYFIFKPGDQGTARVGQDQGTSPVGKK